MIRLAQSLIGKERSEGRVDQRRSGEFARSEAGKPGEEPLFKIRTVIRAEAVKEYAELGIAESE
jgi:hypothetical protein